MLCLEMSYLLIFDNPHSPSQATRFCEGYCLFGVKNTDGGCLLATYQHMIGRDRKSGGHFCPPLWGCICFSEGDSYYTFLFLSMKNQTTNAPLPQSATPASTQTTIANACSPSSFCTAPSRSVSSAAIAALSAASPSSIF